jgi:hypothetical protein
VLSSCSLLHLLLLLGDLVLKVLQLVLKPLHYITQLMLVGLLLLQLTLRTLQQEQLCVLQLMLLGVLHRA